MIRASTLLSIFSASLMAVSLSAAQAAPVAGKDYVALNPAQPVETGDKIEVLEVFSYACPHCYQFEPTLSAWSKTLPADVVVRKMPVTFNREAWANLSRTYYALEAMGELDKLHGKVFDAMHSQNLQLGSTEVLFDWVAKQGVDRKKFEDTFKSFAVTSKVARIPQLTRGYAIDSVPAIVVDGRYKVMGATSHEDMLRITGELVQLARSQRPAKQAENASKPTAAK